MKRMRIVSVLAAAAVTVTAACSESNGVDDLTLADLVGTWNATQFVLTNQSNASQSFDLIQNGGSFTITVAANGTFTGQQSLLGFVDAFAGTVTISGNVLTLTDSEDPTDVTEIVASLSGNTLTLTSSDLAFDFDFDDVDEAADLLAVLRWQ